MSKVKCWITREKDGELDVFYGDKPELMPDDMGPFWANESGDYSLLLSCMYPEIKRLNILEIEDARVVLIEALKWSISEYNKETLNDYAITVLDQAIKELYTTCYPNKD